MLRGSCQATLMTMVKTMRTMVMTPGAWQSLPFGNENALMTKMKNTPGVRRLLPFGNLNLLMTKIALDVLPIGNSKMLIRGTKAIPGAW